MRRRHVNHDKKPETVPKCSLSSFRGGSKVPSTTKVALEASRAAPERSWEAPGTSRGALGSVLGSSESVSETILNGFWSSEEAA